MCIYSPKRYLACSHSGSQEDLVATEFCPLSRSPAVSSPLQRCPAARPAAAGTVFAAPGLCPPCQALMEARNVNALYARPRSNGVATDVAGPQRVDNAEDDSRDDSGEDADGWEREGEGRGGGEGWEREGGVDEREEGGGEEGSAAVGGGGSGGGSEGGATA